jgi:hypothetical protein
MPLKYSIYGGKEEMVAKLSFLASVLSAQSLESGMFLLSLKIKLHDLNGVSDVLLNLNPDEEFYLVSAMAGSLLTLESIPESAKELMRMTAISLFAKKNFGHAARLLLLCGMDLTAAQYLQEYGLWEESLEILKAMDMSEETRPLLRRCAHYYLDNDKPEFAARILASIGDFHPVLAILLMIGKPFLAFHLMMYLDSIGEIKEYNEDMSKYHVQFCEMQILREQIIQKSEEYMMTSDE